MAGFVGITGLAGAGKTTAAKYLANRTGGEYVYLGQIVIDEVLARGLQDTPENERQVRLELREQEGLDLLPRRCKSTFAGCITKRRPAFVDAMFLPAEFEFLKTYSPETPVHLLAIEAAFDVRLARLSVREERKFSREELLRRDETELQKLRTGEVKAVANYTISNQGSVLDAFHQELIAFLESCTAIRVRSA
jgi:dephospho-CoA kinase